MKAKRLDVRFIIVQVFFWSRNYKVVRLFLLAPIGPKRFYRLSLFNRKMVSSVTKNIAR